MSLGLRAFGLPVFVFAVALSVNCGRAEATTWKMPNVTSISLYGAIKALNDVTYPYELEMYWKPVYGITATVQTTQNWYVCTQKPGPGTKINERRTISLTVARRPSAARGNPCLQ